jgi:hypothetical protein
MGTSAILSGGKVIIQNTLYVAKNGDNATALRNRMDKPYLTILEATNNALPGDTVYVYPGTYNEGSADITASDVQYWYEDGAHVICNFEVISDFAQAKNIWVDGAGTFEVVGTNFGKGVVWTDNALSTIYLRCKSIIGRTNGIQLLNLDPASDFDVKFDTLFTALQYGIFLRGNIKGSIDFNIIDSPSASGIVASGTGTDRVRRQIFINGGLIRSAINGFAGGVIFTINTFGTVIHWNNISIEHRVATAGGIVDLWSGSNIFTNCDGTSESGYGVFSHVDSTNRFVNCVWQSNNRAFRSINTSSNELIGGLLISFDTLTNAVLFLANTSEIDIQDTVLQQLNSDPLLRVIRVANNNLRIRGVKMLSQGLSVDSVAPQNIGVELPCTTNAPVSVNITNVVAGTNIIVDSNVRRNTTTIN